MKRTALLLTVLLSLFLPSSSSGECYQGDCSVLKGVSFVTIDVTLSKRAESVGLKKEDLKDVAPTPKKRKGRGQ